MKRSFKEMNDSDCEVEFDYEFDLYIDMGTRKTSNNKNISISFGKCTRSEVVKALTAVAECVGYKLDQMTFGWSTNTSAEMNLIIGYDVRKAIKMRWHPSFTFILQRNQGITIYTRISVYISSITIHFY